MGWSRQERIELHDKMIVKLPSVRDELMRRFPEVISVDLGLREVHGELLHELAWRVFVRIKKDADSMRPEEMIPKEIAGLPTDVHVEVRQGQIEDSSSYRPLWGGSHIERPSISTTATVAGVQTITTTRFMGTLGCFVTRNNNGLVHLLSNEHVIGQTVDALVGQSDPPSADFCCCDGGGVAKVVQGIIGTHGGANNEIDGAVAILFGQTGSGRIVHYTNSILQIGPVFGSALPVVDDIVRKRGRSTELTTGRITSVSRTVIDGDPPNDIVYTNNQIDITVTGGSPSFAIEGDSGSAVVNNLNQVVGLLTWSELTSAPGVTPRTFGPRAKAGRIDLVQTRLACAVISSAQVGHLNTIPLSGIDLMPPPLMTALPGNFTEQLEQRLQKTGEGQEFLQIVRENRGEVIDLINDNREVKVAWNRYHRPSYVGHLIKNINEPQHQIPDQIEGYSLQNLLIKMTDVLERHGSRKLAQAVESYAPMAFNFANQYQGFDSIDTLFEKAHLCPNCGQPKMLNHYAE
jgi:hypothetical protein